MVIAVRDRGTMADFTGDGLLFLALGVAAMAAALLPRLLGKLPVSMPMVFLAGGMLAFTLVPALPDPLPSEHPEIALRLTEVCVIVSLMGAGIAINRPFAFRSWTSTWRLLGITMPMTIAAVWFLGWWALGLGVAAAILLGAVLSPTDPVLATEVQVSEPVDEPHAVDDETRFALTSEAGLNDGLAFPFTLAAVAVSLVGLAPSGWLGQWLLVDVLWRIGVGVAAGIVVGWLFGKLFFSRAGEKLRILERAEGFIALAAIALAYGAAAVVEGYGFIAVFVCAITIRASERDHGYHGVLHTFVEHVERLLTVAVIILLGGAAVRGLLDGIGWVEISVAAAVVLLVRPLAGWIGLTPGKTGPRERAVISFFGVRGIGSLFYVAYALTHGSFPESDRLWAIVGLVIMMSIVVHGIAAAPAMALLDAERRRAARDDPAEDDPRKATV